MRRNKSPLSPLTWQVYARLQIARFDARTAVAMSTELHLSYNGLRWTMLDRGNDIRVIVVDPACPAAATIRHETFPKSAIWGDNRRLWPYSHLMFEHMAQTVLRNFFVLPP